MEEADKTRIKQIAVRLVERMIERGEINPDNEAAIRAATKEAVQTAREAYFAALEYIS